MAKKWTAAEDKFLVEFYETIGVQIGPHDLGRSVNATKTRVKKLQESGAWQAYLKASHHNLRAPFLAGHVPKETLEDFAKEQSIRTMNGKGTQ